LDWPQDKRDLMLLHMSEAREENSKWLEEEDDFYI
jgi:hypothetical protein